MRSCVAVLALVWGSASAFDVPAPASVSETRWSGDDDDDDVWYLCRLEHDDDDRPIDHHHDPMIR